MWKTIQIGLMITLFLMQRYLNPKYALKKEQKRREDERYAFRKALHERDKDVVSLLLARRLSRLRNK